MQAVGASVPVLIAVPDRNLDPWRAFAGDLAREMTLDGLDEAALAASLATGQEVAPGGGATRTSATDGPVEGPSRGPANDHASR